MTATTFRTLLFRSYIMKVFAVVIDLVILPVIVVIAVVASFRRRYSDLAPRIVWGSTPLINNIYWSKAMRGGGFCSETFMFNYYSISNREDFDRILEEEYRWCPLVMRPYLGFISALVRYDVVFTSFDGFLLATPLLRRLQIQIFRLARIKTVVIPYGSDAYVYSRVRSTSLFQGLMISYPHLAKEQGRIARNVDYWCSGADVVIPGLMGFDGLGRSDVIGSSALALDLDMWMPSTRQSNADGTSGTVIIGHAPNHRGFKGTEFVVHAVRQLEAAGLRVELKLLEGLKNTEVRKVFSEDIDIVVEQLIFTGHGLNALEGMASGIPVICNLEDEQYLLPARRWSFFGECPLVSASPESLIEVLRELITRPELRHELGLMSRQYVEKYHGLDSSRYLFSAVIDFLNGKRESIADLYHPLTSKHVNRSPRIVPPLDKNRLRVIAADKSKILE